MLLRGIYQFPVVLCRVISFSFMKAIFLYAKLKLMFTAPKKMRNPFRFISHIKHRSFS